jgi:coenzyme F420-reducing hydrogenase delta subunit
MYMLNEKENLDFNLVNLNYEQPRTKRPYITNYQELINVQPNIVRRLDSGIMGEQNTLRFIKDAGLEIVKVNDFTPSKYVNEYETDIVAREKKYNVATRQHEYQYHIFEVTNFKHSTHMTDDIMNEKIDNLVDASYKYPNAKLWLIPSYYKFSPKIKQRIHNLGIMVLCSGRITKVWHYEALCRTIDKIVTYTPTNNLAELRYMIKGIKTKAQEKYSYRVQQIKNQIGYHPKRKLNVNEEYFKAVEENKILNQIYKANTQIKKLKGIPEEVSKLLKINIPVENILYRAKIKLQSVIEKQRNNGKTVCAKLTPFSIQYAFRERKLCGLTINDTITYFCNYRPFTTELNLSHIPEHLIDSIKRYLP